ncbi:hypothetical protein LOC68_26370 [Blastopirellula sp. JC732]|uniref:Molybdenum cofactor carrier protein n=1 Tax=Blastopirellula sediminis TaxID=2894196 RepID=A0A9X1MSF7_9BACT|nr:hypothetical protein [Blastopirellula sediminis]MCC9604765.1 hypothetical protein [Blastopirellula sediminis]MCC9631936.1 hypothetical protein [Blastopirellula sediminis]
MSSSGRIPVIGVMGSGKKVHGDLAKELGAWIANAGYNLLTGGGDGEMKAVSESFFQTEDRPGRVIGIIPGDASGGSYSRRQHYPNPFVEIPIFTHLPQTGYAGMQMGSRNHINILSSDIVVALPGTKGTSAEVCLAIRYGRPVIALLGTRYKIPGLPSEVPVAKTVEEVADWIEGLERKPLPTSCRLKKVTPPSEILDPDF